MVICKKDKEEKSIAFYFKPDTIPASQFNPCKTMVRLRFVSVLVVLLALASVAAAKTDPLLKILIEDAKITKQKPKTVAVVKVIDGDTIKVQDKSGEIFNVRFIGIDAPETRGKNKVHLGLVATEFVQTAINNSNWQVTLYREGNQKDKYGRYLAWVVVKTKSQKKVLNQMLVQNGLAQVLPKTVKDARKLAILQGR